MNGLDDAIHVYVQIYPDIHLASVCKNGYIARHEDDGKRPKLATTHCIYDALMQNGGLMTGSTAEHAEHE